jgi:hypothetical protein
LSAPFHLFASSLVTQLEQEALDCFLLQLLSSFLASFQEVKVSFQLLGAQVIHLCHAFFE